MEYEVLYYNDDGSAKVRMTIGDKVLEQDFVTDTLDENVKQGMAVFKGELDSDKPIQEDDSLIGKIVQVDKLPDISATSDKIN